MVAPVDLLEEARGRRDRELDLDLALLQLARRLEADVLEDAQHLPVLGHHQGHEPLDSGGARPRGEPLEQPRSDSAPLHLVLDREGDLGAAGPRRRT